VAELPAVVLDVAELPATAVAVTTTELPGGLAAATELPAPLAARRVAACRGSGGQPPTAALATVRGTVPGAKAAAWNDVGNCTDPAGETTRCTTDLRGDIIPDARTALGD